MPSPKPKARGRRKVVDESDEEEAEEEAGWVVDGSEEEGSEEDEMEVDGAEGTGDENADVCVMCRRIRSAIHFTHTD